MTNEDMELVRQYAQGKSEEAFATLVSRHVDLVYSTAIRKAGDAHLAEEIAQAVFILLARKASSLGASTILPGWLYRTTRYAAMDALKLQRRRFMREQEAAMQSTASEQESSAWQQIALELDDAMAGLGKKDHDALVMRFFQNKSMKDLGLAMGLSEEAAKKRVGRALEKLRKLFGRRGVTLAAGIIAGAMAANAVKAAPAGIAAGILPGTAAVGGTAGVVVAEVLKRWRWVKIKMGMAAGGAVAAVAVGIALTRGPAPSPSAPVVIAVSPKTNAPAPAAIKKAPTYKFAEIGRVPGFNSSRVFALNNLGQLAGAVDSTNHETHAFLWDNGNMTDLGTFGGKKSMAMGINDSGDIVGTILLTNGERRAFLRQNGQVTDLGAFDHYAKLGDEGDKYNGGPGIVYYAPPVIINNRAQVSGNIGAGQWGRSFIFDNGQRAYFGLPNDGSSFYPEQLNNTGQILGRAMQRDGKMRNTLWRDGEMIDLEKVDGQPFSPSAINDGGAIAGWIETTNGARAVVWENGKANRLNDGTCKSSHSVAINNQGAVAGYARTTKNKLFACVWANGEMTDLNDMVKLPKGWRLGSADFINDRGQILVHGGRKNGKETFTCLLSPLNLAPPVQPVKVINTGLTQIEAEAPAPFNLRSLERLADGSFRLEFAGGTGARYAVEASTNLTTWERLGDVGINNGKMEFVDGNASKYALRFYRAVRVQ